MLRYNTPLLMVLVFLGLTLVIGFYGNQRVTTFCQYAVGNKRMHTNALVITLLATFFGGGALMRDVPNIYNLGMRYLIRFLAYPVVFWLISLLGLRMGSFMEHLSIAETIGSVYGSYPRLIAALLGLCFSVGVVAIQIYVMSAAIGMCIGSIDPHIMTVLVTFTLIVYAMLGEARTVTVTDLLQFATFAITIPLLIRIVFIKTGQSLVEGCLCLHKHATFQFSSLFQVDQPLLSLVSDCLCAIVLISPTSVQRVYMSSGPIQAYKVFLRARLLGTIIVGGIVCIALLVFVGDPTLSSTAIWPYILSDMSPFYKGCVVISLLGMTMSTAHASLHTAAIMMSHDMVETIQGVQAIPYVHQLRLAKLTILVTGLLAMVVTMAYPDLLKLTTVVCSVMCLFAVVIVPPFILAVVGFRSSARTALIGMATGLLICCVNWKWVTPAIGIDIEVVSVAANGLAMIVAHYLWPQPAGKGWVACNAQQKRIQQLMRVFKKYKESIDRE